MDTIQHQTPTTALLIVTQHGPSGDKQCLVIDLQGTLLIRLLRMKYFQFTQEFWTSTGIAGLSNSASAGTPQRRVAWLLVLGAMIIM